jgi:large subunit ribosomal protein L3
MLKSRLDYLERIMAGIIGKKIRMTQIFDDAGKVIPVTIVSAGPCMVTQVKTEKTDGYNAVQLGYQELKEKHTTKPVAGHCKKANVPPMKYFREFRSQAAPEAKVGEQVNVGIFNAGETVQVVAKSKGRGFQGAMRRHGFSGANKTHGQSDRWRAPGSLGQSSYPSRVFKGLKMAGKMGNDRITLLSAKVVRIDADKNLLFIRGQIPGSTDSLVEIKKL